MLIYISIFVISTYLIYISRYSTKFIKFISISIALLLPSLIAGFRDFSIGTDVEVYGNIWFERACSSTSLFAYTKWAVSSNIDFTYAVLNFIISRISDSVSIFYFVICFIELLSIYIAAYFNRDILNESLVFASYYLLFYNQSLNLIRQGLALAICVNCITALRRRKYIIAIITSLLSVSIHFSAIITLVFIVIYVCYKSRFNQIFELLIISCILFFIILYQPICTILIHIGFLPVRYISYLEDSDIQFVSIIIRVILLCLPYIIMFKYVKDKQNMVVNKLFNTILYISLLGSLLGFMMTYTIRIMYYFDIIFVLIIPYIFKNMERITVNGKKLNGIFILFFEFIYWVVTYVIFNSGETYPYKFIVGVL